MYEVTVPSIAIAMTRSLFPGFPLSGLALLVDEPLLLFLYFFGQDDHDDLSYCREKVSDSFYVTNTTVDSITVHLIAIEEDVWLDNP